MMTKYRIVLQFQVPYGEEWLTVTGRIFESDESEEEIDERIRDLESASSARSTGKENT